jgi:NADH-quinone oxidoreductase subunit A
MTPTSIVGYLALFFSVGFLFLFVNLLVGRFLRPKLPNVEKLEVYECGEPAIGSSFIQFDLRFYVIALLFIIFDVEVALFFPWATVFGKATHLMDPNLKTVVSAEVDGKPTPVLTPSAAAILGEMGIPNPSVPKPAGSVAENQASIAETARVLALTSIFDILLFFAVLMVGFAYVWRRGDLDWVRALSLERAKAPLRSAAGAMDVEDEPALVG